MQRLGVVAAVDVQGLGVIGSALGVQGLGVVCALGVQRFGVVAVALEVERPGVITAVVAGQWLCGGC